jgi:hypothetical protein
VDVAAESQRLAKEMEKLDKAIAGAEARLANEKSSTAHLRRSSRVPETNSPRTATSAPNWNGCWWR